MINGVNSVGNVYVSTPLKKKKNISSPSFSGHVLTRDSKGNKYYAFNLPNIQDNQDVTLEMAIFSKDKNGNLQYSQFAGSEKMPKGFNSLWVDTSKYKLDDNNLLAYRFKYGNEEYTDKGQKVCREVWDKGANKKEFFTLAIPVNSPNSTRPRQMMHIMVDSFNVKNPTAAKRNHFNMLGGTLKSFTEKVKELAEFGVRNVLGTPIFGQDNKSSHGYWTTNPYQITNNLGNYKDFKNLMIELYKNGMSWTADGAFVNEGMEGIHIKDICNWGADSPFIHMFETKDLENVPIRFGVFSKNDDVNEHIHIKLVNAPYRITFEKTENGYKESKVEKVKYNPAKPTYIQLFDDRLASEEQMNNAMIFDVYANKEAEDRFAIASSKDSVQPLHFKVTPEEVKINYAKYSENKSFDKETRFKNLLTQWKHFSLVNSNRDGGVSLWVGNNDISKKRFVLPEYALKELKSPEKEKAIAAQYQVQDDTIQVGKYWTGTTANLLIEYTAKALGEKILYSKTEKVDAFKSAIEQLISEGKLYKDAASVFEKDGYGLDPLTNMLSKSAYTGERKYNLKSVKMPENVTDGLMSYPFDAIEFSPDVLSVFAYPYIKNMAVSDDTVGLDRYQMYKMGDEYYNQIPEEYRKLYKETDKLIATQMTDRALDILRKVENRSGRKILDGNELTKEGREIYSLISADIAKFLIVSSLTPKIYQYNNSDMLDYDLNELQSVDLNSLNLQFEASPEDTARALISKLRNGLYVVPKDTEYTFVDDLVKRIEYLNSDTINVAKLIVDKLEAGLDWRIDAAKDTGDWENQEAGKFNYDKNKDSILNFWNKFNKATLDYNPRRYAIGELTDWNLGEFIEKTNFTTMSDYSYFYSTLPALYGQNDEGKHFENYADTLKNKLDDFLATGVIDNLNFAHRFVGNQDKPRILHLLGTNVKLFNDDKGQAVIDLLNKAFEGSFNSISLKSEYKDSIYSAIKKLSSGYHTVNGKDVEYDAENFGIRPFDFTIDDIIDEAAISNESFSEFVKNNQEQISKFKAETLKNILENPMKKYRSLFFAMVGLPGTPTNYAGDEFGMTGWETFCKNEKQENRNAIRWDWLEDSNYDFIKNFREEIKPIMNIRNKEAASALVNGTTQPLHKLELKDGGSAAVFYRYNDKTDAIVILHGEGYGAFPEHRGVDKHLSHISLGGLKSTLPVGTIYCDALDENKKYKVTDNNVIKRIDENGNATDDIDLGNAGLILLREHGFDGKKLSFKGRVQNAHVKLANTKFNFNYMSK